MLTVVDARPLAVARIGLGLATVMNAVEMYVLLGRIAEGKLAMPVFPWIPRASASAANVYLLLAVLAGVAIAVGYRVAFAAIVSTVLGAGVFLWDQQTYSSHRWLALLLVACLVFARSDTVWAFSSPRRERVPFWPQLLMMTQLSVCYFFAAASKINAPFLSGAPLSQWVWVPLPSWVFTAMAVGTVIGEFFLAFALWGRRTRGPAIVFGLMLHVSIVIMLTDQTWPLVAFALTCVSLYWLFLFRPSPVALTRQDNTFQTGSFTSARVAG